MVLVVGIPDLRWGRDRSKEEGPKLSEYLQAIGQDFNDRDFKQGEAALLAEQIRFLRKTLLFDQVSDLSKQAVIFHRYSEWMIPYLKTQEHLRGSKTFFVLNSQGAEDELTPLQKKLNTLGRRLGVAVIMVSVIVFLSTVIKDEAALHALLSLNFFDFMDPSLYLIKDFSIEANLSILTKLSLFKVPCLKFSSVIFISTDFS